MLLLPELEVEVDPAPLDCRGSRLEEVPLPTGAAKEVVVLRSRIIGVRREVRCMVVVEGGVGRELGWPELMRTKDEKMRCSDSQASGRIFRC